MARKDLLKGLMAGAPETKAADPAAAPSPAAAAARPRRGAIGAVSQSIADLKSRAIVEIAPDLIDSAGLVDRLEHDPAAHAALVASIRDHGQQVPVLVRPHPDAPGRYKIVFGRRRALALRDLGLKVKAMVRDLDDRAAILAQGQENTARRDLSFIEKVNFARQMREAAYDRKTICDALDVDKTLISRMLSVADRVPVTVIEAIGSAPSVGRERWLALAGLIEARGWEEGALAGLAAGDSSDRRFEALHVALADASKRAAPAAAKPEPLPLKAASGRVLGEVRRAGGRTTLSLRDEDAAGFERWLVENITEIHRDWMNRRGE